MIKAVLKLSLPAFSVKIMILLFLFSCNNTNNENDFYKEVLFVDGLPKELVPYEESLPFKNFSYSYLETGSDSLQVLFGTLQQGSTKGHWIALLSDGKMATFSGISLEQIDSLNYRTKDIDVDFNDDRNRISVRIVELDSLSIKYSWIDDSSLSEKLILKEINKPLRIGLQFPEMDLESISGKKFPTGQFDNRFVVINWWATWCAPCIKEIPELNGIVDKYKNNDNVKFIAITDDPKSRIKDFLKQNDFKYEMTFANSEVRTLFGNFYPTNIIIDPSGSITYLKTGAGSNTPNEIESSLNQQIKSYYRKEGDQTD